MSTLPGPLDPHWLPTHPVKPVPPEFAPATPRYLHLIVHKKTGKIRLNWNLYLDDRHLKDFRAPVGWEVLDVVDLTQVLSGVTP